MMRFIIVGTLLLFLTPVYLSSQGLFESAVDNSGNDQNGTYRLQGSLKSAVYTGYNTDKDQPYLQSIYSQLNLGVEVPAGKFGKAFADLRFRYGQEFGARITGVELRETYADLYLGPVTLRAGKQILSWGAAGFINPSDRFSPVNPTFRSPDMDEQRLGTWALKTTLSVSNTSRLEFLWLPDYRPSELLTGAFQLPGYIEIQSFNTTYQEFSDSGFGLRYDLRSKLLDLQLSYYNGFRNTPVLATETFVVDTSTFTPKQISLAQQPARVHSAGLNLTIPVGSYLIRTEIGWLDAIEDSLGAAPFTEIGYVLEIEQSGSNISLIAGYYGKYIFDFEPTPVETAFFSGQFPPLNELLPPGTPPGAALLANYTDAQVKGFNRLYEYQQDEWMHAAYAIADISMFNELASLKIPGMYNFTTGELTLMPALNLSVTDGFSAEIGAYFLNGKAGSLYDMIAPSLNAGYLQLKLVF
jgi:hypothetical protein